MRSSGTKEVVGATVLLKRKSNYLVSSFEPVPVHKVVMSVFGSLKVSFGTAQVGGGGGEQHVVVSQGGLDDRGGAGVVREVWVRRVDQGWSIGDDLEQNLTEAVCLDSLGSTWVG